MTIQTSRTFPAGVAQGRNCAGGRGGVAGDRTVAGLRGRRSQARQTDHAVCDLRGRFRRHQGRPAGLQAGDGHRHRARHDALQRAAAEGFRRARLRKPVLRHHDRRHAMDAGVDQQDPADHRHDSRPEGERRSRHRRLHSQGLLRYRRLQARQQRPPFQGRRHDRSRQDQGGRLRHLRPSRPVERADDGLSQGSVRGCGAEERLQGQVRQGPCPARDLGRTRPGGRVHDRPRQTPLGHDADGRRRRLGDRRLQDLAGQLRGRRPPRQRQFRAGLQLARRRQGADLLRRPDQPRRWCRRAPPRPAGTRPRPRSARASPR